MRHLAILLLLSLAFAAPTRADAIPGSWSESCDPDTLFVSGNIMSARCATPDGGTMASAVDISTCGPDPQIGAPEGRLVCEGEGAAVVAPPAKVVVLNRAAAAPAILPGQPASFAGSWAVLASDGSEWALTLRQSGTELTGTFDGNDKEITFKGEIDGARAVTAWVMMTAGGSVSGGSALELVLFGNGQSIGGSFLDKSNDAFTDDFLARRAD